MNTVVGTRHPLPENIPHSVSKEAHANTSPTPGSKEQDQLPGSFCGHPPSTGFHRKSSLSESADSEGEGEGEAKGQEGEEKVTLPESEGVTNGEDRKEEVNLSLNNEEVPIAR